MAFRRNLVRAAGPALACALLLAAPSGATATAPTAGWRFYYGLEAWETALDHDHDGFSGDDEFAFGTNPTDPLSHPPQFVVGGEGRSFEIPIAAGVSYASTDLQTSTDLVTWFPVPGFPPAPPATFGLPVLPEDHARFFRFRRPGLANADGDCLTDFEELNLFHTDPARADTDGDGLDDCAEVLVYHTDPNRGSGTGRGAIRGQVVLDEDRDPATQNHPGLAGWTVFVDLDFDGEWDATEPSAASQDDGRYVIAELDPGFYRVGLAPQPVWTQVFPALSPAPAPDGYPDRVVEVFDSGTGPIPFPYGRYADPLPGQRLVFPSPPPDPVEASVVLGALPPSPIAGPFGGWTHVDILAIPTNSFVTVAFDGEEIVDGPGPDLAIWCAASAPQDTAELWLGSTPENLTVAGVFAQQETILVDLATVSVPLPVRYVKLRGLGLVGTYPGIDVVGFEALHYRPRTRGYYDVTVVGGQTVEPVNFGVAGEDRPPRISIGTDRGEVRAGEFITAQVTATDDVGVAALALTANGVALPLDAQQQAVVPVTSGGLLTLVASATDTAGQQTTTLSSLIARNADGSLPDLSGLGATGGSVEGGPSIQVVSPVAGEILAAPRVITGSILGTTQGVARWQVHYAPVDAVNPEALDASDPDYVLVSEGTGPVMQGPLGLLAGDTLPAGAYLLRVAAADVQGTTRYTGFVIGVRVDPLDIRPAIALSAPTNDARVTYLTEVRGSITTRQPLREWSVEYAPLSQVNLQNLADPTPTWARLAQGTSPVTEGLLGRFDPTLLPNDAYVIRVSAWNQNGLGWAESVVVQVTGNAKLGHFTVAFTDIELPLAGFPITLKRVYHSLHAARSGDFGYGWSLALQEADIAETVPQVGRGLGSTPFRVGTRVYLTAPDGQRLGFTLEPELGAASLLGAAYRAVFKPDPGIRHTLEVPEGDDAFLSVRPNGDLALFFLPVPWNPDTYILTDPAGLRYTYDQDAGLIEMRDPNGNRVTFTETAITHSTGPALRLARDGAGRITQVVAPDGRTWRYQYDAGGDLVQVTYPGDRVATFGYAANRPHFLETLHDPVRGPSQRTEYDETGRVVAIVDAQGNRREQNWDPGSFTGTFTDARGHVTKLTYDARGNLTRREDPLGGVSLWEYKNAGYPDLETATVDPRGNRTTYTYDARGNLTVLDAPGRHRNTYKYDEADRLIEAGYGTGGKEEYGYDARGNLVRYKQNLLGGGEWTFTYTAGGALASVLDPEGGLTRLEYDTALGLPSRIIAPDGGVRRLVHDAAGRLREQTDPRGGVTRYEYDDLGRLVRQLDPAGAETRTTYDPAFPFQVATVTDRVGRVTQSTYDALGRVIQVTAPGGAIVRYEYDADGNRTAVVDPLGHRYAFGYDAMSRLVVETDPLGRQRTHAYDLAGNRIESTDRNGRRRTFAYNTSNRLAEERWLDPASGQVVRSLTYDYDPLDRLRSATDPEAALEWIWLLPPGNRLDNEQARYAGLPTRRIASGYDKNGRRAGINSAAGTIGGWNLAYTRDTTGRLRIVTSRYDFSGSVPANAWQLQYGVNARGDVTELRRFADQMGEDLVSQSFRQFNDPCGCGLDRIEHVVATNQPLPEATVAFTRNAEGEITGMQDGPNALSFAYDSAGQLTKVTRNGTVVEHYAYDVNGNRVTSHRHAAYTLAAGNRLASAGPWSLDYDPEGNLLSKSNTLTGVAFRYTWDHRNRLTRVEHDDPGPPAARDLTEYRYDGLDRRIAVIHGGGTNWTYYDGLQPLMDYVNADTAPAALYFSGEQLDDLQAVWRAGEGFSWTLTDHLGTVRRVLRGTNGVEIAALEFDSYGNPTAAAGAPTAPTGRFGFTGREWEAPTGLYYHRARYYDPDLGRFISEDPIGFAGGDVNLYRYVGNRPWTYRDPTGLAAAPEYALLFLAGSATLYTSSATAFAAGVSAACKGASPGQYLGAVALGGAAGAAGGVGATVGGGVAGGAAGAAGGAIAAAGAATASVLSALGSCFSP